MGRRQKRGKAGNAAQYLTRTKAIRKLQLRLSEFRRLCILKGIHPREPKKKVHGANKTYYHIKDINWLMHEPLLQIFRNMKSHERKVRKAYAKFNPELAARLRQLTPTYKLDHLVKERYPTFVDALRDLDDALTMVHLFATLPAEKRLSIPTKAVETAKRLALEWSAWVVRSSALRKAFVSVKGIYFQAEVLGQSVTWLIPHQLAQVLPTDVDFKVMVTFLEFYECLLQFVNYKLYHTLGLKYPPVLDPKLEEAAAGLAAVMRELAGVREEEGRAADNAVAALRAADNAVNEKAAARLKALDATKIAALTSSTEQDNGTANHVPNGRHSNQDDKDDDIEPVGDIDSGDESDEADSEAGLESDDDQLDGSDDDNEDDDVEDDDADSGDEQQDEQNNNGVNSRDAAMQITNTGATTDITDPADGADGEVVAGGALGEGVAADDDAAVCATLFKGLTFFMAREVPREPLALVIRSFGGTAAWDGEGSPCTSTDDSITHHVVDRPQQGHKFLSRQYVQPQFVFDCANFRVLLPAHMYAPGKAPPPHLSPFVNDEEEGYMPDWAKEVKKLQEAAKAARMRASGLVLPEGFAEEAEGTEDQTTSKADTTVDDVQLAEIAYQAELSKELRSAQKRPRSEDEDMQGDGSEGGSEVEEESDDEGAAIREHRAKIAKVREQEAADEEAMNPTMMTSKTRKFYERAKRSQEGKRQRIEQLHERKAKLQKKTGKQ